MSTKSMWLFTIRNTLGNMTNGEYIKLKAKIAVLKEVQLSGYQGQTIDNIIRQLEAIVKHEEVIKI